MLFFVIVLVVFNDKEDGDEDENEYSDKDEINDEDGDDDDDGCDGNDRDDFNDNDDVDDNAAANGDDGADDDDADADDDDDANGDDNDEDDDEEEDEDDDDNKDDRDDDNDDDDDEDKNNDDNNNDDLYHDYEDDDGGDCDDDHDDDDDGDDDVDGDDTDYDYYDNSESGKESLVPNCVFMNMSAGSYRDRWASQGCKVSTRNETHVVCSCFHLTNFAVLMDVYNNQEDIGATHDTILSYLSYIGGGLSIVACVVAICVFQYFRLASDRVRIHQQLGVSIILVQVLYICVGNTGRDYNTPVWGCRVLAIWMHYSLTALFCWMLVEGIHLYVVLVRVFRHGSHIKKYTALGWGVPLIVVAISVAAFTSEYGTGRICWLTMRPLLVCFVPTVGLVLMINTVVLATVIRVMVKSNSSTNKIATADRSNIIAGVKATVVLLPLLGLTWVLGFLAVRRDQNEAASFIFTYLFTVTNSCQGVFFLVMHCLLNVDVQQAYERRFSSRRRSSRADTTSLRLRKFSENDVFTGNKSHGTTTTTRSTLTDLSVSLPRLSFLGHHRLSSGEKHPIIGQDEGDGLSHVIAPAWHSFTTGRLPEPDYPQQQHQEFSADDTFGVDNPIMYSPQMRNAPDDIISGMIPSRPQRNSVRFSSDSDLSL
ncbi:adhesion G protein-coupled receptor L3 [Elysia marginata]|uniref:Adhesion G protein-coupled receptor L3 n=1 Tax=Elysia marginata TaxID=1093978 RepID=A0AAV4J8W9_9GAST|nr:adhesion G protein-coupled receptor L3 [Elysia marginata]